MTDSLAELLDERRHLLDVATRLSGSETAADRIVQETYRRWYALPEADRASITAPRAWLTRELLAGPAPHPLPAPAPRRPAPPPLGHPAPARHEHTTRRFAAACAAADPAGLFAVLSPDVVVVSDGGGKVRAPLRPTHGADAAALFLARLLGGIDVHVAPVNGRTGLVLRLAARAVAVVSVSVAADQVTAVWIVLNPDKLEGWQRS